MIKNLYVYFISGFIFVCITGTISHFLYDFFNQNTVIGLFSPVNESVWEHMKLIFFPMLIYSIFLTSKFQTEYPCIKSALLLGTVIGIFLIPILFYTYTAILGYNKLILDISIFIISVFTAFLLAYKLTFSCKALEYSKIIYLSTYIISILFFIFSYFPPNIKLFRVP